MGVLAPEVLCLAIAIVDGDTLRVRCDDKPPITIRLAEIDAPEKAQPFGTRSRQHLAKLCFQQQAEIRPLTTDRYGRMVARVTCAGTDANAAQVSAGMAWAFTKYLTDSSIKQLEQQAREARRGLWSDPSPVPPWDWRHTYRHR
jgi:micrococcal nuclease